jgi:hypothetical protein
MRPERNPISDNHHGTLNEQSDRFPMEECHQKDTVTFCVADLRRLRAGDCSRLLLRSREAQQQVPSSAWSNPGQWRCHHSVELRESTECEAGTTASRRWLLLSEVQAQREVRSPARSNLREWRPDYPVAVRQSTQRQNQEDTCRRWILLVAVSA